MILRAFLATCLLVLSACTTGSLHHAPSAPPPVRTPAFTTAIADLAMTPWTTGNSIRTLENGDGFFPPMLRAVLSAKESITFECYTARDSLPVALLSRALIQRAQAGVRVHVILDAFGCAPWGDHHLAAMRKAGVQLKLYNPFNLLLPLAYQHRTHRRVLVVDGRVGFCGGAGWAFNWTGHAQDRGHWRDTQYELHGPVVAQLQDNFADNWRELTGTTLRGPAYYPPLRNTGTLTAQMVVGSPIKQRDTLGSSILLAIRAAQKSILIEHSYFLPTVELRAAILAAAKRGVRVQIIIPGENTDMPFAKEIMQHTLRRLMDAGVELFEFQPTMLHSKLIAIDDHLIIAGSGNLDPRSFFINDENNLHVLSPTFAHEQRQMFQRDLARSKRLTEETLHLSLPRRLRGLFGPFVFGVL